MSLAAAGAIVPALAVSCAVFAPFAPALGSAVGVGHRNGRRLHDANWRRPLWQWESLRAGCMVAGAMLSIATPLPLPGLLVAAALAPSFVARSQAAGARWRARHATPHLLRATEAALRSGAALPEALRRACGAATEDRLGRRPFVDARRAFDLGAPLDHALQASADRANDS